MSAAETKACSALRQHCPDRGRIAEIGTRGELLTRGGIYAKL